MKKILTFFAVALVTVAVYGEPVVRIVSAGSPDKTFATDNVRKLVLSTDAVKVVNNAGSVLLTVPLAEMMRVEFADGTPDTPTGTPEAILTQDGDAVKIIERGQVYILHSGRKYTVMGVQVENKDN